MSLFFVWTHRKGSKDIGFFPSTDGTAVGEVSARLSQAPTISCLLNRGLIPCSAPTSTTHHRRRSFIHTRWASYCEMMRHKRWMSGGGGGGGGAGAGGESNGGSGRALMPGAPPGGPPVPPPWVAGEYPSWRYRLEERRWGSANCLC